MITKKEYSALDAKPVVLYAKTDVNSQIAYPIVATTNGQLLIADSMAIPSYDYIDYSDSTSIKFYSGGAGGTLVATITLTATSAGLT